MLRMFAISLFLASVFLAPSAPCQEVAPDTLAAAKPDVDSGYVRCLEDLREIDDATAVFAALTVSPDAAQQERDLMRVGAIDQIERIQVALASLAQRIPDLKVAPDQADSVRSVASEHLANHLKMLVEAVDIVYSRVETMWGDRSTIPLDQLVEFESRIDTELKLADEVLTWLQDAADHAEPLAYDTGPLWVDLDGALDKYAANLGDRLRVAVQERDRLNTQLTVAEAAGSGDEEISDLRLHLQTAAQRLQANVEAMRRTIRQLERRKINVSPYRQILVEATGEVSEQLLDWAVLKGLAGKSWQNFQIWLRDNGPSLVIRALILVAFVFLFRWTARLFWLLVLVTRVQRSSVLLRDMMSRMLMPTASMLGLFGGLWFLGVNPTTLLAGVGVASVILGLALQDSLANLAAGAFILLYRPYDVDDTVQAAGVVGMVKAMGLANTTILTFDNRRLFVPNRKIWSEVIENRSMEETRRVETIVRVEYGEDVDRVKEVIHRALADSNLILDDPVPSIFVSELADSWIEISVWPWSSLENWWQLRISLPHLMLKTLHDNDIRIPYERRDIAMLDGRGQTP